MISLHVFPLFVTHLTYFTVLLVLASISRIFGSAKKKKPLYRIFFYATMLLVAALAVAVIGFDEPDLQAYAVGLDVAGLLLGAVVTYFYWEWLPRELFKE